MSDTTEAAAPPVFSPDPKDTFLCTYPLTLDGFVAAWIVRGIAKKHDIAVEFEPERGAAGEADITGRNWLSIGGKSIISNSTTAKSAIQFATVPEVAEVGARPLPFSKWERTFPFGVESMTVDKNTVARVSDSKKSLSLLVYEFFYADRLGFERLPRLIDVVNDATTGAFKYNDTQAIIACLLSYPQQFRIFDSLAEALEDRKRRELVITGGQAILRYQEIHN